MIKLYEGRLRSHAKNFEVRFIIFYYSYYSILILTTDGATHTPRDDCLSHIFVCWIKKNEGGVDVLASSSFLWGETSGDFARGW
jgi:hypothetical protein